MNHWLESAEVLSRLGEVIAAGEPAALATVVRVVGSAYRRPGAKLLVVPAGGGRGGVSGGCLEGDVREVARQVLATGTPRLLHYDTSAGDEEPWALGLGCRGQVDVFVQPASAGPLRELAARWRTRLAEEAPFAAATVVGGAGEVGATLLVGADGRVDGTTTAGVDDTPPLDAALVNAVCAQAVSRIAAGHSACEGIAGHLVFLEVLQPPPDLLVCGAGDDAMPLVELAADAGFRVTVLDHRQALLAPDRFPRATRRVTAHPEEAALDLAAPAESLAVVMTHAFASDREWVRRLLAAGLRYVGLLGPRARTAEIRRALDADDETRLYGPVGLDLGADGPRQVAISIVAELLGVVAGRTPQHLSERVGAIHVG